MRWHIEGCLVGVLVDVKRGKRRRAGHRSSSLERLDLASAWRAGGREPLLRKKGSGGTAN
jgi:hypothetical protein